MQHKRKEKYIWQEIIPFFLQTKHLSKKVVSGLLHNNSAQECLEDKTRNRLTHFICYSCSRIIINWQNIWNFFRLLYLYYFKKIYFNKNYFLNQIIKFNFASVTRVMCFIKSPCKYQVRQNKVLHRVRWPDLTPTQPAFWVGFGYSNSKLVQHIYIF